MSRCGNIIFPKGTIKFNNHNRLTQGDLSNVMTYIQLNHIPAKFGDIILFKEYPDLQLFFGEERILEVCYTNSGDKTVPHSFKCLEGEIDNIYYWTGEEGEMYTEEWSRFHGEPVVYIDTKRIAEEVANNLTMNEERIMYEEPYSSMEEMSIKVLKSSFLYNNETYEIIFIQSRNEHFISEVFEMITLGYEIETRRINRDNIFCIKFINESTGETIYKRYPISLDKEPSIDQLKKWVIHQFNNINVPFFPFIHGNEYKFSNNKNILYLDLSMII